MLKSPMFDVEILMHQFAVSLIFVNENETSWQLVEKFSHFGYSVGIFRYRSDLVR